MAKKINWKSIIGWGIAVLVIVGVIGTNMYQHREVKGDKPVVKIGAVLPLSGTMAFYGNTFKNMYLLRMKEIPANSKYDYKLIIEDDEMQTAKSMTAAQKLFNLDDIDLLLGGCSGAEPSVADIARDRKKVMFSLLWDEETPLKNKYSFNALLLPDQYINLLLEELQKRDLRKIAIVMENHKGWLTSVKNFKEKAPQYGLEVVEEQYVVPNERDFRTLLYKIETKKNPDAYLVFMFPASLEAFGRTLKEQEIKKPVTSLNSFDFVENKNLFNGVWYASDNLANAELEEKYKETYGKELLLTQSLWGYAALDAVINAYEKYDTKPTAEQIIQELYKKRISPAVGEVQYKGNGILRGNGMLRIIQDGKSQKLEK